MSKVVDVRSGGGDYVILGKALVLPSSSTDGTDVPLDGSVRFNPTTKTVEIYSNQAWRSVTGAMALTVATLPSAVTALAGARSFVTDSSVVAAGNFGVTVVGGGVNSVPVYSDGTNWRIG